MKSVSDNFKKLFLLHFTRELILHSTSGEVSQLQNILKEQAKEEKQQIVQSIKRVLPKKKEELTEATLNFHQVFREPQPSAYPRKRILMIPEIKLPPHLQYLQPVPSDVKMDLGKLDPLMKDPIVRVIECDGPDEHILVQGGMGTKPTNIVLTKEEIKDVIKKFSELAKIPLHEGIYQVVVGKVILSAIISEVIDSKFIIKKMLYPSYVRNSQLYPVR
jgi:hypothetical protein